MTEIAWRMGHLVHNHSGLSALGSEAVAVAQRLNARVLVSSRDDGPGIQNACIALGIRYQTLQR